MLEFVDINPCIDRLLDTAWEEKKCDDGSIVLQIKKSPWRRWRPPCLTGKTKLVVRILKYDGDGNLIQTQLRALDGVEYFNIMGWSRSHWRKVTTDGVNEWNSGEFSRTELLYNMAGNAFSPYSWIAVQMSTLAVHGHFLRQYAEEQESGVVPNYHEAKKKTSTRGVHGENEPRVCEFDDSTTCESDYGES